MIGGGDPASGLSRAALVFMTRLRTADPEPADAFLRRHEDLREWLEPMLAEPSGEPETVPIGEQLGPFRLLREIGRGGMGVVHEARRGDDPRPIALKVLPGFLAMQPGRTQRFEREAALARPLLHPGIAQVLDSGAVGDTQFLAMQFVVGAPLDAVLEQLAGREPARLLATDLGASVVLRQHVPVGVLPPGAVAFQGSYVAAVVRIAIQLGEALGHLHVAGVLHRDVKPSNVLLCGDGRVVLTDFGLARAVDGASLTLTGDFAGTPNYVSPEQAMAKRVHVDHRSDLFSLGSTLYELLTLQKAFPGDSTPEVLGRILSKEPPPPGRFHPGLPPDLATVLAKLLEKDPDRRYRDAGAVVADLRAFLEYRPVAAQRPSTLTRVLRWTRREPLRATLALVLLVTIPALTVGAGYLWARAGEIRAGRDQLRQQQVRAFVDAAFLAAAQEDSTAACARFEQALALDGGSDEAGAGFVYALLRRDGPEAALRTLDERLAGLLPPDLVSLLRHLLLHRLGRGPEADAVPLPEPRRAIELFLRGMFERDISVSTGTRLLEDIERAVLASEGPRLWIHLHWAVFAEAANDAASCRRCAANLLANWPDNDVARYFACLALRRVEPERAMSLAREGLAANPEHGLLHWAEGVVLEGRGDLAGATAAMERAVSRLPSVPSATYTLGKLWFNRGDWERALVAMHKATELAPRFVEAWMGAGMCERRLGRSDEALASLRHAVNLHGTHSDAHFQLGQLLVQRHELAEGLQHLQRAAALNPGDANKWHHVASALFATGDDVGGENALRRAVRAMPGSERSHSVLVMFLQERGTPAQVREALLAWVEAMPASSEGWLQYGRHCATAEPAEQRDAPGAAWAARRVLALTAERSGAAWLLLGEAQLLLGDGERARPALQRALSADLPLAPADRLRCEQRLAALPSPAGAAGGR